MKTVHIISVGKLKDQAYLKTESDYIKRLSTFKVVHHELKSHKENLDLEAKEVIKKLDDLKRKGNLQMFVLTERGKHFDSPKFSNWLYQCFEKANSIAFIIGGASGHGDQVYNAANGEISLSKLTFPHQMVRALIAEQLYRAETIKQGHPYSK